MLPIFGLTALLIIGLLAWLTNRAVKNSLSKKLGRKVKDHEVTSLSAWMNADDKKLSGPGSKNARYAASMWLRHAFRRATGLVVYWWARTILTREFCVFRIPLSQLGIFSDDTPAPNNDK